MCIEVGETFMKQDLVFFILLPYTTGYCSSRAVLKMAKLTEVYISNTFIDEYTGRQNNNQGPL